MDATLVIKRKEAIILAAIEAISEYGVQAISTKEIAKRQGVSERVIFKHFETKNDLLSAVLDHFAKYDDAIIQTAEAKGMRPFEAITYFFEAFSTYYENYPAITAIAQSYNALLLNTEVGGKAKAIFKKRAEFIAKKLLEAKGSGLIGASYDIEALADIINGAFMHICLNWRSNGSNTSLREKVMTSIQMILQAFKS